MTDPEVPASNRTRWQRAREARVRERALESLKAALHEAGDDLSAVSVRRDPDQAVLRGDPKWEKLLELPSEPPQKQAPRALPSRPPRNKELGPWPPSLPTHEGEDGYGEAAPIPERPWGSPRRRLRAWGVLAALSALGFILLLALDGSDGMQLIVAVVCLFAVWRSRFVAWELVLGKTTGVLAFAFGKYQRASTAPQEKADAPPPAEPR